MKRRTLFSVGSSSAPISTPSVGSSRNAAANGPASRARSRRSAIPSRSRFSGTGRLGIAAMVRCASDAPPGDRVAPCSPSRAAAVTRARTPTSPRAPSGSRSSTRPSPSASSIAEPVELKLSVRNADDETLRNVAVTVQTEPEGDNAAIAFGQRSSGTGLADSGRPIWVLDEGPLGGDVANVNTWSAGTLRAGETRELTWKLVAARAGHVHDRLPRLPRPDRARPGRPGRRHERLVRGRDRRRAGPGARRRGGEVVRGEEPGVLSRPARGVRPCCARRSDSSHRRATDEQVERVAPHRRAANAQRSGPTLRD